MLVDYHTHVLLTIVATSLHLLKEHHLLHQMVILALEHPVIEVTLDSCVQAFVQLLHTDALHVLHELLLAGLYLELLSFQFPLTLGCLSLLVTLG